jgi:hypothetical protein
MQIPYKTSDRILFYFSIFFVSCFTLWACNKDKKSSKKIDLDTEYEVISYPDSIIQNLDLYWPNQNKGNIAEFLHEVSGIAVSRSNPSILWAHEDHGNLNKIHLIGEEAQYLGYYWIWGVSNRDWEDICIGPGPEVNKSYVYLGDIGDNDAKYNEIYIHRFEEPNLQDSSKMNGEIQKTDIASFTFKYPDGARDAEALMIDPWNKDLYILSKNENQTNLYLANFIQYSQGQNMLDKIAVLPFLEITAADISSDGNQIMVKTEKQIYFWNRNNGETILEAIKRTPYLLPYKKEAKGEALAIIPDGGGYYTLSEKSSGPTPSLYFYKKK